MRIRGLKHARRMARWGRSRFTGGALILGYHRIASDTDDFYSNCVRPERFEEQLQVVVRYAHPITLDQLVDGIRCNTVPKGAVVLTFDDGYVDNLYQARPLLEQYDVPATLFVASGYLGTRFWWDELADWLMHSRKMPAEITLDTFGERRLFRTMDVTGNGTGGSKKRMTTLLRNIYRSLLELSVEAREMAMIQLRNQLVVGNEARTDSSRAMSADELCQMADCRLIAIGAHTVSHPVLTSLPLAAREFEIEQSKRDLEALLNRPVSSFSYPNGAADDTTRKILWQSGFTSACASYNDVAHAGSDPLYLPRFWAPDWDGNTFARWLRFWLPPVSRRE